MIRSALLTTAGLSSKNSQIKLFRKAKENQVLWPQLHNVPVSPVHPKQVLPFPAPNLSCPAQPHTAQLVNEYFKAVIFLLLFCWVLIKFNCSIHNLEVYF